MTVRWPILTGAVYAWHMHRQPDSKAIASLIKDIAAEHGGDSWGLPRVVLEVPQPNTLNGKHSWYSSGFAYGVWHGALASQGFEARCPQPHYLWLHSDALGASYQAT
jgi:hypothetical protein